MAAWEKEKQKLSQVRKGKKKENLTTKEVKNLMKADQYTRVKGRIRQK